jgi:hypothetical protein
MIDFSLKIKYEVLLRTGFDKESIFPKEIARKLGL